MGRMQTGKEEHWLCGAKSPRSLLHSDSCPRASLSEGAVASREREKGDAAPSLQLYEAITATWNYNSIEVNPAQYR